MPNSALTVAPNVATPDEFSEVLNGAPLNVPPPGAAWPL